MRNLGANKLIFSVTAVLALIASVTGAVFPAMYADVVPSSILPGIFTQDLMVAAAAIVMLALTIGLQAQDVRKAVVILGVLGFFFYAYGIYGIEQVYTSLHILYLAVWAASFYAIAFGFVSLDYTEIARWELPAALRAGAAWYGVLIAVVFNVLWIGRLIPLIRTADRIEYLFSVFIIDLVFIMPAFVIAAALALRGRGLGVAALPALFVLGFGILSPLALAEWLKPVRYGVPSDSGGLILFGVLSALFLVLAAVYLAAWRPAGVPDLGDAHPKDRIG